MMGAPSDISTPVENGGKRGMMCEALLSLATPELFKTIAFRVTGLAVDASVREITRHADKLKMMEELGQRASAHTGAFALNPPPTVDDIRDAIQQLRDPELRLLQELFWFWPESFGDSAKDAALQALERGSREDALAIWSANEAIGSQHNIAVLWHIVALQWEEYLATAGVDEDRQKKIEGYWTTSLQQWSLLLENEGFWERVAERAKRMDDPRLTTGLLRRIRHTFPQALLQINALLALRYAEKGQTSWAKTHVGLMGCLGAGKERETRAAERILAPASSRLKQQIQRARERGAREIKDGIGAARELLQHGSDTLPLFELFSSAAHASKDDLSDEIATVCNRLQLDYHKATGDNPTCLQILRRTLPFAISPDLRKLIEGNLQIVQDNFVLGPIRSICQNARAAADKNPRNGLKEAQTLQAAIPSLLANLSTSTLPASAIGLAKDELALALMNCAIVYGNKVDQWKLCIPILENSLALADGAEATARIRSNLAIAHRNYSLFGVLKPIKQAPDLWTVNGCGFTLYGSSGKDEATKSYLANVYFVIVGIPLFPVSRYRLARTILADGRHGYRYFGKAPFRTFDKWHLGVFLFLALWLAIVIMNAENKPTQRYVPRATPTPIPNFVFPSNFLKPASPTPTTTIYLQ